jgi:putative ABC transport system substrate-binding protein
MTHSGHQSGPNPAPQRAPDLMLANPLCCHSGERQQMPFDRLQRREFITLLGGAAAAWPGTGLSQTPPRRLIGVLLTSSKASSIRYFNGFPQGMRELGYVEGHAYVIEERYAESDVTRLPVLAEEMVRLKPDVIVTGSNTATLSAMRATATIPIVATNLVDPVGLGLASSEARSGNNLTGTLYRVQGMTEKLLEIAFDLMPGAMKIGHLFPAPLTAANLVHRRELEGAAAKRGLELIPGEVLASDQIGRVFQSLAHEGVEIVICMPDPRLIAWRRRIAAFALAMRLPMVFGVREHVEDGGLISYGVDLQASYHRAAYFVDRILKGAKPADLPIEFPTKLELVINLTQAIGVTIPPVMLARAVDVIE